MLVRRSPLTRADFPGAQRLAAYEGGAVYTDERQGKFYLIQDESTLADLLSEEDLRDLSGSLVKVVEFDTAGEREDYIRTRGWSASA